MRPADILVRGLKTYYCEALKHTNMRPSDLQPLGLVKTH
jgi:hypothetical protein